jgi:hypothetical protein
MKLENKTPLTMAKVEASLPLLAKEGCLTLNKLLKEKATQSCLEDKRGQQINKTMTWKRK